MTFATRLLAALLFLAPFAHAATLTVSSSADSGPGTLRQAILDANATAGADQIVFAVSTVNASSSLPQITDPVAIDGWLGSARVTITGVLFDCSGGFFFAAGSSGSTLMRVTVENYCESVRVGPGVTDVTISGSRLRNGIAIAGDDNVLGGSTGDQGNLIDSLTITGDRNQVYRTTVLFGPLRILFADQNRLGRAGIGNSLRAIQIQSSSGTIIEDNLILAGSGVAIDISNQLPPGTGASILDNTIHGRIVVGDSLGPGLAPFTGVTLLGNEFAPTAVAIDLGGDGTTPNDPAPDADTGANHRQNFPVLTSAVMTPSQLVVNGTLTSAPLTTYTVQLFSSHAAAPTPSELLASFDVNTDAAGNAAFTRTITPPLPGGDEVVLSTATNRTTGDTSEVSAPLAIDAPNQLEFTSPAYEADEADGFVLVGVGRFGDSEGTATVSFTTENGSATAPADYAPRSGTLTFGPGVTWQGISIPIVRDAQTEAAETFTVRLSNPTGATLGTALATVTITANAGAPAIPTLSTWALIALALGLATLMVLRTGGTG